MNIAINILNFGIFAYKLPIITDTPKKCNIPNLTYESGNSIRVRYVINNPINSKIKPLLNFLNTLLSCLARYQQEAQENIHL